MIDFRSDTVTRPSQDMLKAMLTAPVGDDVYGDDETVNRLEKWVAKRHGFEAAIFCSSGTQANLLALMAHCQRGDEYLCGQQAHNYKFEGGGAAVLGSIQPQPIENEIDGSLSFIKLKAAIKPIDPHFARTKLLSLENTINGKVLPISYLQEARKFVNQNGLQLHLDGARVYNATIALEVDIKEISCHFDSMTICLSKGLGAPVGSLLLGSKAIINSARRWRKVLGGGMRQVGFIAAAGHYALTNNIERLSVDHTNARYLAEKLTNISGFKVNPEFVQTNMVFAKVDQKIDQQRLCTLLKEQDILVNPGEPMRFVTHLDISRADIDIFLATIKKIMLII
jgi:threonine aldolase